VRRKFSDLSVLLVALAGVLLLMWILNGSNFMNIRNLQSMAYQMPELGVLSLAMMIAMLTGGINLSIIATANLSGIVIAYILTTTVSPETTGLGGIGLVIIAIAAGLLVAVAIGLLNGYLIAVLDISPILTTLGTMIMVSGFSIVLTRGYVLSGFPPAFLAIGNGNLLGIPSPILVFIGCAVFMSVILNQSALGTRIYLIGSNPTACFFSGVNNRTVLIQTYALSGLLAGIAAIIMISRFNSAKADYGESYLLMTVLAAVLGGVSASGGFGRVSGLIVALVILQFISSGLNLMGVNNFLTVALWGSVLILVMMIQYLIGQYRQKRRTSWNIS
jgi:simple sugar transport system permease protein